MHQIVHANNIMFFKSVKKEVSDVENDKKQKDGHFELDNRELVRVQEGRFQVSYESMVHVLRKCSSHYSEF